MNNKKKRTFNKSDILASLNKEFPNISKYKVSKAIDVITNLIVESVALDDRVEIRGFGSFSKKLIRPRKFVNPKTKKISYVGETASLHFKPSKSKDF